MRNSSVLYLVQHQLTVTQVVEDGLEVERGTVDEVRACLVHCTLPLYVPGREHACKHRVTVCPRQRRHRRREKFTTNVQMHPLGLRTSLWVAGVDHNRFFACRSFSADLSVEGAFRKV